MKHLKLIEESPKTDLNAFMIASSPSVQTAKILDSFGSTFNSIEKKIQSFFSV